jgi:hypothetical protein
MRISFQTQIVIYWHVNNTDCKILPTAQDLRRISFQTQKVRS